MIRPSKHVSIIQPYSIAGAPLPPGLRPPIQMERQTPHMIRFSRGHEEGYTLKGNPHVQTESEYAPPKERGINIRDLPFFISVLLVILMFIRYDPVQ